MKLLSIIAEYNPFHNGHLYHLNTSKSLSACTHNMVIMSGSFLQRGEPALVDKWTRAKMAVTNGVDLVVELPFVFSCQSAEIFAYGSILTLNALNTVDILSFGSEVDHLDSLSNIARILIDEPMDYKESLKKHLDMGLSFPRARQMAVEDIYGLSKDILSSPNNILAIEYLKWIYAFKSKISPLPILRKNTGYHDEKVVDQFAGATYIRNSILNHGLFSINGLVPATSYSELNSYHLENDFNRLENYFPYIVCELLKAKPSDIKNIFDVGEGLENRILKALYSSKNMEEFIDNISTKRYTKTRIKRILVNYLLSNTTENFLKIFKNPNYQPYLRVLAFNEKGKEIIKEIKENSEIHIITNLSKEYRKLDLVQKYSVDKDILSSNYFYMVKDLNKLNSDFTRKPEIIY